MAVVAQPDKAGIPPQASGDTGGRRGMDTREVLGLLMRLGQRIFFTVLLLVGLMMLVSVAMFLARGGGIETLTAAVPAGMRFTYDFTIQYLSGQGDPELLEDLSLMLPKSLGLLFISLFIGVTAGLLLGALAAVKRNTRLSSFLVSLSMLGISTPSYVVAMFLIWAEVWIYRTYDVRLVPTFGFGWDQHLILPTIVLASRPMSNMMRLTYTSLIDIFNMDFVRTAHSKGLMPRMVFWRHILRNAGVPLLTTAGVSFRFSLAMLPVVEVIFSWPGIGLELLGAIRVGEIERVVLLVLPLAVLFALVNILLDFSYPLIDPRIRAGAEGG